MSFSIRSSVSSTILLGDLANQFPGRLQAALNNTRDAGLAYLRSESGLPIDTGALVASADAGDNQASVYFKVAQAPGSDGKMYGIYQNQGWHDRGGGWHDGHHFMENTAEFAMAFLEAQVLVAIRGSSLLRDRSFVVSEYISQTHTGPTFSKFNPGSFA